MERTLYCFIGESGSGKNAVVTAISQMFGVPEVVSYTARPPRYPGESGYIFSDEDTYQKHKAEGLVFEETEIENKDAGGNIKKFHYWTLKSEFDFTGKKMLICDKEGIKHVKDNLTNAAIVAIHIKADAIMRLNRLIDASKKPTEMERHADARARMERSKEKFMVIPCDWAVDNNGALENTVEYVRQIMNL